MSDTHTNEPPDQSSNNNNQNNLDLISNDDQSNLENDELTQNDSTNNNPIDDQNNNPDEYINDDTQTSTFLNPINPDTYFENKKLTLVKQHNDNYLLIQNFLSSFNEYQEYQIFILNINNFKKTKKENGFIQFEHRNPYELSKSNQTFLSHYYKEIPTNYNLKFIAEQYFYYMKNPKFSLANLYGFTVEDPDGNFIPTVLTNRPVNGPLSSLFESFNNINSVQKFALICGIIHGICFIHHKGFIHSNLNPETVYIDENMFPVICDYAFVQPFDVKIFTSNDDDQNKYKFSFDRKLGRSAFQNPLYAAPEIFKNGRLDQSFDIYSLGLVIFFIISGKEAKLNEKGEIENYEPNFCDVWKELINNCINKIPKKRPKPKMILKELLNINKIEKFISVNSNEAIEIPKKIEIYLKIIKSDLQHEDDEMLYSNEFFSNLILSTNDLDNDTRLIVMGAEHGNTECIEKVGDFFYRGENNFFQSDHYAYLCYDKAAEKGKIESMKKSAKMNEEGIGTEIKLKKSYTIYKKLLEKIPEDDPERPEIIKRMNEIDDKMKTIILKNIPSNITSHHIEKIFSNSILEINLIKLKETDEFQDIRIKFDKSSNYLKAIMNINRKKIRIANKAIEYELLKDQNYTRKFHLAIPKYDPDDFYQGKSNKNFCFLYRGPLSKSYLIYKKETEEQFVAKVFSEAWDGNLEYPLQLLIEISTKFNHPAIIKYDGYIESNPIEKDKRKSIPTLLMKFYSKENLEDIIESNPLNWNDTAKLKVIIGIASALTQMHSNGFVHNNLKPSNILLNDNLEPVICDFGITSHHLFHHYNKMTMRLDSPIYIAPELMINIAKPEFKYKPDSYAFGVILFQILTNTSIKNIFPATTQFQLVKLKLNNFVPLIPDDVHPLFASLIKSCFNASCNERPDMFLIYEILIHDVKSSINLLPNANMKLVNDYLDKLPEIKFFKK